jgi:anti-anti-sigma factor
MATAAPTPAVGALALGPDLTIAQAAAARETLLQALEAGTGDLALDLGGVSDVDSASVQLLLATRTSLHQRGDELLLVKASPAVRDALATFGLAELLTAREG